MSVLRTHRLAPGEPLIELNHVARRFTKKLDRGRSFQDLFIRLFRRRRSSSDDFWPLRDLTLTVNPGDCIGVIGPNGSGKSTLLKLITGILPPTYGDVIVRGRVSSLLELGAGFQSDLTGRENIYLNGSIYGLSRAEMTQRLDKIIDYAGLGDFIDTPVKHYSSGMYVRLGFAVAIHTEPDLLLVDEVLAVGDVHFQNRCMESIYNFRYQGGTLLLVSHDLNTIQSLCNRALWIDNGLAAAEGSPADVVMAYKQHMADLEEAQKGNAPHESIGEGQRWGTREVEITGVELFNANGQPRTTFNTGEPLTIRLNYHCAQPIEHPVFGFGISHQNGVHIYGPNTKFASLQIDHLSDSGSISYTMPELPLLEGQYVLSVAVVNDTDTVTYDYHDRAYKFRVAYSSLRAGYGMVQLRGEWHFENGTYPTHQPVPPLIAQSGAGAAASPWTKA
jgi:ABC-type polysaccharide/polyol phosphate transport system ATPase subunit